MFTNSGFGALELTEEQITALSEKGKEIQDALEDVTDEESLDRRGAGTVLQLVRRLPLDHREEVDELRKTIEKLRDEARTELLEHQLDLLIEQALRHLDLGAIKFQEIAALVDISDAQQERLAKRIKKVEREFWREAVPGVPSLSPGERQALRAAEVRSVRELQPPRSEERLAIAYVNREAKVVIMLKDVLRPEQLEEVKRLVKIARDE